MAQDPNFNALWLQLMQKLNPEFIQNNGELIGQFLQALQQKTDSPPTEDTNLINIEDLGLEDPNDLYELVEIVPKYNDLVDEYEHLLAERDELEKEAGEIRQGVGRMETLLGRAKRHIEALKTEKAQLEQKVRMLDMEMQMKDRLINQFNLKTPRA